VQRNRSDRGGEYVSIELAVYEARKGIVVEMAAGSSPESNGAAKHVIRTLLEHVLCYWMQACPCACGMRLLSLHVVFGIGRPCLGLGQVRLEGGFLAVSLMCSISVCFGCLVLCHVPKPLWGKWDPVRCPGVIVGCDGGGDSVLVNGTRRVKVCRDAAFLASGLKQPPLVSLHLKETVQSLT
jgi:hypothetical protein